MEYIPSPLIALSINASTKQKQKKPKVTTIFSFPMDEKAKEMSPPLPFFEVSLIFLLVLLYDCMTYVFKFMANPIFLASLVL